MTPAASERSIVRILVVDDEAAIRDAYRQVLLESDIGEDLAAFHDEAAENACQNDNRTCQEEHGLAVSRR